MATSPFDELSAPAPEQAASSPFEELEAEAPAPTPAAVASPFEGLEAASEKPEPYQPTEEWEGQHAYLKDINAVTKKELNEIAAKNKIDPAKLEQIAPYWGVGIERSAEDGLAAFIPTTEDAKKAAGMIGRAAMNLPQYLYKVSQDPGMQGAIDDLAGLARTRKSAGVQTAEFVTSVGAGIATGGLFGAAKVGAAAVAETAAEAGAGAAAAAFGKEVVKGAAAGAGFGAVGGLAESRTGEEAKGVMHGALSGAAVGGALGTVVGAFKAGGLLKKGLGAEAQEEFRNTVAQVEEEMARPEVASQVARGEERVVRIARGEERVRSSSILDRKEIQKEVERLQTDDEYLVEAVQSNPDLIQDIALADIPPDRFIETLARRQHSNREMAELVEFADYLKNPKLPLPKDSKELAKMADGITESELAGTIQDWTAQGRGESFLRQEYKAFKASQIAGELNAEYVARGGGVESTEFTRKVRGYFRVGAQMRIIDNRSGTGLEREANRVVQADNLRNREMAITLKASQDTRTQAEKSGLLDISLNQLEAIEKGKLDVLAPEQQEALKDMSGLFKAGLERARALGLEIAEISKEKAAIYIPKMQVDRPTTVGLLRDRVRTIEEASGVSFKSFFNDAQMGEMRRSAPKAYNELIDALQFMSGEEIKDATTLSRLASEASTVEGTTRLISAKAAGRSATAAMARAEEGIPGFLRETDMNKLYVRWISDTFKSAYLRDSVQEITKQRNLLASVGDRAGVEYVDHFLRRLGGQRIGLSAWMGQKKTQFAVELADRIATAERKGDTGTAKFYKFVAENSDFPSLLTSVMYSNLLSTPKAFVQNLVQPMVTAVPELSLGGNGWAAAKTVGAYLNTIKKLGMAPRETIRLLEERGYMAPHPSSEVADAFRTGFERGAVNKAVRAGMEKWTNWSLSLLQASETANRITVMNMGESIARDLMQGSKTASEFMKGMGRGYQYRIGKLIEAGDASALEKEVTDYLIAKTMYHYSPLMMNVMGEYFGKIASSFTTWPSTVTADIVGDFAREGGAKGTYLLTKKYLAPLGALTVLDHWASSNGMSPDQSERATALLGKGGFKGMAPIKAATDVTTRGIISSPYVDGVTKALAAAVEGDATKWWRSTKDMGKVFIPVYPGVMHLLDTTIPRLKGETPDKDR